MNLSPGLPTFYLKSEKKKQFEILEHLPYSETKSVYIEKLSENTTRSIMKQQGLSR